MKCIAHSDTDAVSTCIRCGAGICKECVSSTFYEIDNKPLCKDCNYKVGIENDQMLRSALRGKWIKMTVFLIAFIVGIIVFFYKKHSGDNVYLATFYMLLCWSVGMLGDFFSQENDNCSTKAQVKEAYDEIQHPFATIIGKILGFLIFAATLPIQIVANLIRIISVKKQISENEEVLNRFIAENTENNDNIEQ